MNKIKAIVVDDEVYNRRLIINLISELNAAFEITGEAGSVKEAYGLIRKLQPQVVFLDIKMPDGSGFALLNMFSEINFEVVFISAFNSYALKAFEFNALDYILKPIDPDRFGKNLDKVQAKIEQKGISPENLKLIMQSYDPGKLIISKIPVHSGNKVELLDINDIIYIQSQEGCTLFNLVSTTRFLSSKKLSDFEFILERHPCMIRINKSTYINLNHILNYSKGRVCYVTMRDEFEIEIPRRKKAELLEVLDKKDKS